MRIGHHASARDRDGRYLPDRIWGWDMPVVADFPGKHWDEAAQDWTADLIEEVRSGALEPRRH